MPILRLKVKKSLPRIWPVFFGISKTIIIQAIFSLQFCLWCVHKYKQKFKKNLHKLVLVTEFQPVRQWGLYMVCYGFFSPKFKYKFNFCGFALTSNVKQCQSHLVFLFYCHFYWLKSLSNNFNKSLTDSSHLPEVFSKTKSQMFGAFFTLRSR